MHQPLHRLIVSLLIVASSMANKSPAQDVYAQLDRPLGWSLYTDAIFWDRSSPDKLGGTGLVSNGGTIVLDNGNLSQSVETGWRIGLVIHNPNICHDLEFLYLGNSWDTSTGVTINNVLTSVLGTADYTLADSVSVSYNTQIDNFEVNNWSQWSPWFASSLGFRTLSLDEQFNLGSTDNGRLSNYVISTDNDLYGLQIGAKLNGTPWRHWHWDVAGKVGVYGNIADKKVLLRDLNNTVIARNFSSNDSNAAFVGELNANLRWQVARWLGLQVGYQFLWVEQVALAPEQFQSNLAIANAGVGTSGSAFMHGLNTGLTAYW